MKVQWLLGATLALALCAHASGVMAIQQRSFVSITGSDAGPCQSATPCRSFTAAIAQTLDNGEIVVLDSGGYGAVVVNKSVDIVAPAGVYAGITTTAGTAIQIVSPAFKVALRGIAINGLGTGQFGIDVQAGSRLIVDRCRVANFVQDGLRSTTGGTIEIRDSEFRDNGNNGVTITQGTLRMERSALVKNGAYGVEAGGLGVNLFLHDTSANNNGASGAHVFSTASASIVGGEILQNAVNGVLIESNVASAIGRVAIDGVNISHNNQSGVFFTANATSATIHLSVTRSQFAENFNGVVGGTTGTGAVAKVIVSDSAFGRNAQDALSSSGTGAEMTITRNSVSGSAGGVSKSSGGALFSTGDNAVHGNTSDSIGGAPTVIGL